MKKHYLPFEKSVLKRIASAIGTPVYVYSGKEIEKNLSLYFKALKGIPSLVCYALKANPCPGVCKIVSGAGAGADVVSGGELKTALECGFPAEKIVFSGVGKTRQEHELALKAGVLMVNLESREEMFALERVAARHGVKAPVCVRINPGIDPHTHKYISTGKSGTKFGVEPAEAMYMYDYCFTSRWLNPVGIHCHLGSQIHSSAPYIKAAGSLLHIIGRLGGKLKYIDIGGGWGVKEGCSVQSPAAMLKSVCAKIRGSGLKLIVEPGRSIAASSGVLLTTVLYRKSNGGKHFVIADAGMNNLIRPALYGAVHPVASLDNLKGQKTVFNLAGPVCESGDFIAENLAMPLPPQGAVLAVLSAGAYGFAMSSQYNSRPLAPQIIV